MLKRIILIVGTRPEAIKVIPVYLELKKYLSLEVKLVSTGQHREMLDQIFSFFEVRPEVDLDVMKPNQNLSNLTSTLFQNLSMVFSELRPDLIFVQGDTTTAMVSSLVAYYQHIQVAHIEAGLRSYNNLAPFPEEVNRKIISLVTNFHFAPTEHAAKNLEKEGVKGIYLVGNTVIDSLLLALRKIDQNRKLYESRFENVLVANKKIILVTAHRRESFGEGIRNICVAIQTISTEHPECQIIFPVHLNPNIQNEVMGILSGKENIKLIEPLAYDDMIYLLSKSYLILSDSGGVQEEAPTLNVPIIVLRDITERPEGVAAGCAVLAGLKNKEIVRVFNSIYKDHALYQSMADAPNPYGEGQSSKRIVDTLQLQQGS